jgi:ribosomal protein S18 acetylase RimI-like enzyme
MLGSSTELRVRRSKPGDAAALADVFACSWRQAYSGIIPHASLEAIVLRRGRDWWSRAARSGEAPLILTFADKPAGYATFGAARAAGPLQGEIYELYLGPSFQGLGFGEYLFEASRSALDERGLKGLVVWALSDNEQAIQFYWSRGGRPVAKTMERMGRRSLEKVAFGWD